MYIVNKNADCVISLDSFCEIYIGADGAIKAVPNDKGNSVLRMADYASFEMSKAALNDLIAHIPQGGVYRMPDDERAQVLLRGMKPDNPDKFASNGKKTVRRGGS